jgi:hypothetical protein
MLKTSEPVFSQLVARRHCDPWKAIELSLLITMNIEA